VAFLGFFGPEEGGTLLLRNVPNHSQYGLLFQKAYIFSCFFLLIYYSASFFFVYGCLFFFGSFF
jgi:hypothetical protein